MSAQTLTPQLKKTGRKLARWRAGLKLTWCLATLAAALCVAGLVDLWFRLDPSGRFVAWGGLIAITVLGLALVLAALRRRYTPDGVAAMIEKKFPELDSRLINYLQFSRAAEEDAFQKAYVESGEPAWRDLDLSQMRDRRAHRRSKIALGVTATLLILPTLFFGQAWGIALWRTVNPFADTAPASLTKIVDVQPGNTTVLQGQPVVLTCDVEGFLGHEVGVEIDPGDSGVKTYLLGKVSASVQERFSHRVPKVATSIRYRVRAGDAPKSAWFTIDTQPPPTFTAVKLDVTPPENTKLQARSFDARAGGIVIPAGSDVKVTATADSALDSVAVRTRGAKEGSLEPAAAENTWEGNVRVDAGDFIWLSAAGDLGATLEEEIGFTLHPDKPPEIEIVAPSGRTILPPGERPQIQFNVVDDYGLAQIRLEEIPVGGDGDSAGAPVENWAAAGRTFDTHWKSNLPVRDARTAFRVVAIDNRTGTPNRAVSAPIIFSSPSAAEAARLRNELEEKAFAGLQRIIDLQRRNLGLTEQQRKALAETPASAWENAAKQQQDIRDQTRDLLANPIQPLGGLTASVKKLYANDMVLAIDALKAIPTIETAQRMAKATEAVTLENKILRALTHAESAASQAKLDRRLSGISAMIQALVRDQTDALKLTQEFVAAAAKVSEALVDSQDYLAEDLTDFVNSCNEEASAVRNNDPAFADTLAALATRAGELGIRNDMVQSAEHLSANKPNDAIPLEQRALTNLKTLQAMLTDIQLEQDKAKVDAMLEAVAQAKEKVEKVKDLHAKMVEAMEQVRGMKDKNDEMVDYMEEAYEELVANTKESMLEVPTDLHVFTDLNVANDVVEDVFSLFEEIEQAAGSEEMSSEDVIEQAYAKEEVMLEMMEEATDKLDDMEMWLGETPDNIEVTTEAFDREEMPESGIATGALSTEVQDMIGDLLDEDEDMASEADDGATTHAMPDMPMGWEVMEGDISSFAGKGMSGNDTPDHKEQDGRSNVGRQGMSVGETSAGSGTISEGDKNIEERRTEDPTQSGQIDLAGEADTKATGGGKLGTGKADDQGMSGGNERMDSNEAGSSEGMAQLMARQADAIYAKASMKNVRVDSLKDAAHHLRTAADAVAQGDIQQVRENRRMAVSALRRAQAELEAGPSGALDASGSAGVLDDVVQSGPDSAPPQYRGRVADYYKALNEEL